MASRLKNFDSVQVPFRTWEYLHGTGGDQRSIRCNTAKMLS